MAKSMNKYGSFLAFIAAFVSSYAGQNGLVESFSPQLHCASAPSTSNSRSTSISSSTMTAVVATPMIGSRPSAALNANNLVTLYMSDSDGASDDGSSKQKKKRPDGGEEGGDAGGDVDDAAASAPSENPEVVALKAEIKELESSLSKTQSSLQYALDQCEEYSKTGYARKVAEMENMRRIRNNMASSSQSSATAGVLRDFLPVFDKLNELRGKYGGDSFGSAYKELTLQNTFANLGVTDYNVQPGEPVNNFRMKVLEREMSTEFAKDTIIRQTVPGLELDGNVIRAASCVASSGSGDAKGEGTE